MRRVIEDKLLVQWFLDLGLYLDRVPRAVGSRHPIPLESVALNSTVEILDLLLKRGTSLEKGNPLHYAAISNKPDADRLPMMSHLLMLGYDVDSFDRRVGSVYDLFFPNMPRPPLYHAVLSGHVERTRLLLDHGADPHRSFIIRSSGLQPLLPLDSSAHCYRHFVALFKEYGYFLDVPNPVLLEPSSILL